MPRSACIIGSPILGFSLEQARKRIETLSWVDHATVERRLPGTVVVQPEERRPFAIWQHDGKFVLIDRNGQIVTNEDVAQFRQLPLVVGAGAPEAADPPAGRAVRAARLQQRVDRRGARRPAPLEPADEKRHDDRCCRKATHPPHCNG